ncbi:hypothetical protein LCGC14_2990610, partial [marine sediment metagenome]
DDMVFYYYYFPKGDYEAIIKNADITSNSIFQIDSKFIGLYDDNIPINSLNHLNPNPTQFLTLDFEQDDYYDELYEATYVYLNITEPGQYLLNTTIDSSGAISRPTNPSAVVVYNSSAGTYHDWTDELLNSSESFPAFSDDGTSDDDILYIAYPKKWFNMDFEFSQLGSATVEVDGFTWNGYNWEEDILAAGVDDMTYGFSSNGSISYDTLSTFYTNWTLGADFGGNFNLLGINKDKYYWLGIKEDGGSYIQLPYIQSLKLVNITFDINVNLALVGESGYKYCDFWQPPLGTEPAFEFLNQLTLTANTSLFNTVEPYTTIFEEGLYKLLIIPEGELNYNGPITITFALKNQWSYRHQETYNIPAISRI